MASMQDDIGKFLPLSPAWLHIMVALAGQDLHGYGIMQEVAKHSDGQYKLGPGTLYDNLQKLLDQGLVQESGRRRGEDERRRYYRLTSAGKSVVVAEIGRLEAVFRKAKAQLNPKARKA
jgi:DNA-binding PadR family transcriptional regulator